MTHWPGAVWREFQARTVELLTEQSPALLGIPSSSTCFCRPQSSFLELNTAHLIQNETPLRGDWQHLWIQVRDCTTGKLNAFIEKSSFWKYASEMWVKKLSWGSCILLQWGQSDSSTCMRRTEKVSFILSFNAHKSFNHTKIKHLHDAKSMY